MRTRMLGVAAAATLATFTAAAPANAVSLNDIPLLETLFSDEIPLAGFGDIVVDTEREQVFVSGGPESNGIVVTDLRGNVEKTIEGQQGATGLALSEDGTTLYAALTSGDAISEISTEELGETARHNVGGAQSCPTDLSRAGANVWFSYGCGEAGDGKIGRLDTAAQPPVVVEDQQGDVVFQQAPLLASGLGEPGPVVAGNPDLSLAGVQNYTYADGKLTKGAASDAPGSNLGDLAVSPDGTTLYTAAGSRNAVDAYSTVDFAGAGSYASGPHPVAVSPAPGGKHLATGTATGDEDNAMIYEVGGAEPVKAVDVDGADIARGGLAWSANQEELFIVTLDADGKPSLEVVHCPLGSDGILDDLLG